MDKLLKLLEKHGLCLFPSWSGFGAVTDWPNAGYQEQLKAVPKLCDEFLPPDYVLHGPEYAAGGALVFYIWKRNDSRVEKHLANHGKKT